MKNPKRTHRIYSEEQLQLRTKRRKKFTRPRIPIAVPTKCDERWSIDSVSDQLANGRRFRVLNIMDNFTRECVGQLIETSTTGLRMSRFLDSLDRKPKVILCDNGPELNSKAMFFWARNRCFKLHRIHPGKPTQNAFVESFNGKFREYCLNLYWFRSLEVTRFQIDTCRKHCDEERPHGSLGRLTPNESAEQVA